MMMEQSWNLWGHLWLLMRANSKESVEFIFHALWRTQKTGLDAADGLLLSDILQLQHDSDLDPIKGFLEKDEPLEEYGPTEAVDQLAKQLRHAWCSASSPEEVGNLINWKFPRPEAEDEVIINTDARVRQGLKRAGIGGVCRDISGAFVADRRVLAAELLAIRTGLSLASKRACKNVTIESDSLKAVQLMNGFDTRKSGKDYHFDRQLFEECLRMINKEGWKCVVLCTLCGKGISLTTPSQRQA